MTPGLASKPGRSLLRGCLGLALLLSVGTPWAAGLQVSPISLDYGSLQRAQGVWLSNTGRAPLRAQLRVKAWTQTGGGESLDDTGALIASPPLVDLPPGERQLVRIVRLQPTPPPTEMAFRLLIDELPTVGETEEVDASSNTRSNGLVLLLRYSIPIFISPATVAADTADPRKAALAGVTGQLTRDATGPDGAVVLAVRNTGARRVKLSEVTSLDADGTRAMLAPGLLGYVLPGVTMRWRLQASPPMRHMGGPIQARFNDEPDAQILPVGDLDR